MKWAMLVIFDAQTLMLDIGRLTYGVPCGKVGNNVRRTSRYYEKQVSLPDPFLDLTLTSMIDPDKVRRLVLRKFATAWIAESRMGR
jgi:hypothetical protein